MYIFNSLNLILLMLMSASYVLVMQTEQARCATCVKSNAHYSGIRKLMPFS